MRSTARPPSSLPPKTQKPSTETGESHFTREQGKLGLNVLLNAPNLRAANGALRQRGIAEPSKLIAALKARHPAIAHLFHADLGAALQVAESNMAVGVLTHLAEQGIAALPVHDAFIVQARHEQALQRAMMAAFMLAIDLELAELVETMPDAA